VNYCGVDLAGVSSYAYVTDAKGRKLWSGPIETTKAAFERLVKRFKRDCFAVAIEAGNQTVWVYDLLVALGAKVTVVNPTKVKLIAESRRKTDKIDAQVLCELLRLDALPHAVHMPGPQARQLRGLLVAGRQLVFAPPSLFSVAGECGAETDSRVSCGKRRT
jgi:transposase